MDLQAVRHTAAEFGDLSGAEASRILVGRDMALGYLENKLPTLEPDEHAAVAWVVAEMMTALLNASVLEMSDLVADTAASYALATCKLHGLIP